MATATVTAGTPAYQAGRFGQAVTGATVTGTFGVQGTAWTWDGWVTYPAKGTQAAFLGWGAGTWVGVNAAGNLAGSFGATGQPLTPGGWHHVAVGFAAGVAELWIDGQWVAEVNDQTSNVAAVTLGGTAAAGVDGWTGAVDDVRVTAGRRYPFYVDYAAPTAAATVDSATAALWRFDGNLTDATGATSSNTGTPVATTDPTAPATGSTGTMTGNTGTTNGSSGGSTTGSYTASTATIPTQGQGWFQYTETHYYADNSGYSPLNAATLTANRTSTTTVNGVDLTGRTVVFRYFYLEKYKTLDTIDQAYLNLVAADLAAVRAAGCTAIIRFAYLNRQESDSDATPARTFAHVDQLATVVNQYADVVHAIQAGFIGAWGEWYYTYNWGDSGNLTAQNVADRNALVRRILDRFDARIFVLLRYLGSRQTFLGTTDPDPGGADSARLGHHNDSFLADDGNYGTYNTFTSLSIPQNRAYLASMPPVPVGGESSRYNPPMTEWPNASTELASYRYSYLNPNYYGQVINIWGQANCDTAARRFGHRLRATTSTGPSTAVTRAQTTWTVTVTNDGWGAPTRDRPAYLLLDDGQGHTATGQSTLDLRTVKPGTTATLTFQVVAPATAGTYTPYLWLPDVDPGLAARPEYAWQLANTSTWQATTGRNRLAHTLTVTGAGSSTGTGTGTGGTPTTPPATSGTLRNLVLLNVGGTVRAVKLTT